ncbi:MAG TPA: FAD-dependent monooxygenase [Puia sp.]
MLLQNKTIAIVGGGPGGLTLSRLLQGQGAVLTVYERDADRSSRGQGTTLDLHEDSGLKALRIAGLLEEFKKRYRPGADRLRVTDKNAKILFDDHAAKTSEDFGSEHFRPEIDRGPLRDLLIESLLPGTIRWNTGNRSQILP